MKTRVLSGLIMTPLLVVLYFGGPILKLLCVFFAAMAIREFFNGFRSMGIKPCDNIAYAAIIALYAINMFTEDMKWYMLWFFACVLAGLLYLFKIEERRLEDALATITGIFYIVFFSYHIVLVDGTGEYGILVWLIVLSAFGTDIMAYFTGVLIGKHKLCPKISPKKTIEGSIGGILGSVILCGVFGWILIPRLLIHCIIIGVLGGVISQFGDLTASVFKRKMGIKDYGNLIPGHGGVLDRFDSVLFTAPMVYYYIVLILM